MTEADRIREILASLPANKRLFRINSGMGFVGQTSRPKPNIMLIKDPRPLHAAPEGWPDLCGWTTIEITEDMVGQKVAVFTAEEVKVTGRLSAAQRRFGEVLTAMGGIFKVVK